MYFLQNGFQCRALNPNKSNFYAQLLREKYIKILVKPFLSSQVFGDPSLGNCCYSMPPES